MSFLFQLQVGCGARDTFVMPKNMDTLHRSLFVGPSTPSHTLFNNATDPAEDTIDQDYQPETRIDSTPPSHNMDSLMSLLEKHSSYLEHDVDSQLVRGSTASEFVSSYRPEESLETPKLQKAATGTKRKLSDVSSDSDSDSNGLHSAKKRVNRLKTRQRYKKNTVQDKSVVVEEQHVSTEVCTVASTDQIAQYFAQDFSVCLNNLDDDCKMTANRFSDYMSETACYMFVVKKSDTKPFEVVFAKFINNACKEYINNYQMVDNRVFVVVLEKVKFMVSYKLVRDEGIEIPPQFNFHDDATAEKNPYDFQFQPVKNTFQATLINHFHLDMYYSQTILVTLFQSLGETKAYMLINKLHQMLVDCSLFTLPIMLSLKEPVVDNTAHKNYVSSYVDQIIKFSKNIQFPEGRPNKDIINRLEQIVTEKSTLTYKYSSVANLLFNKRGHRDKNANILKKIKKEDGNRLIVEQYMSVNENDSTSHNFIVLQFGGVHDERLTIAKKGNEFYWIAGEIKDIDVDDFVKKYTRNVHHVFRIVKVNRRESTTWHNNLLKLLQLLLQNLINIDDAKRYSEQCDSKFYYKML